MLKTLKRVSISLFIWTILEISAVLTLYLLYVYNIFNLQTSLTIHIVFDCLFGCIGINAILIFAFSIIIAKKRNSNNLVTEQMFGENIEESFEFSQLGILVVDDSNTILWNNETMNQLDSNLVDKNTLEIFPKLKDLQNVTNSESTVKVSYKDRSFDVSFIQSAGVYFFKDTTEYDNLLDYSKEQQMVLGIIMIDNLAEFAGTEDEAESSDLVATVRTKILDYFKSYGVLLRRFKNDSYFAVCNYNSLVKLEENSFEILDIVRSQTNEDKVSLTLSIGFAHDYPGPSKLNEKANDALEMAISRGGDQVVVDKSGVDLKFFGGKTEAIEKKNKIKVRLLSNSLNSFIKGSPNVIIIGHAVSDMDSVGSCLGIKAMCNALKVPSKVVFDFGSVEKKARLAVSSIFSKEEFKEIFVSPKDALNLINMKTLVICADFHRLSLALSKDVVEAATKVAIIDHHRRSEEFMDNAIFTYIESSASSASELVTDLIQYSPANPPITVPPNYATLMLAGIFVDTNFYRSTSTGARTFEASMILRRFGADNIAADNFLKDDYEERALITKILTTMKVSDTGVVYCMAPDDLMVDPVILSKVANECISMKGINASFVLGKTGPNEIKISARSDGTINVQLICEQIGSGGGHFSIAASVLHDYTMTQAEDVLNTTIKNLLDEAKSTSEHAGGIGGKI